MGLDGFKSSAAILFFLYSHHFLADELFGLSLLLLLIMRISSFKYHVIYLLLQDGFNQVCPFCSLDASSFLDVNHLQHCTLMFGCVQQQIQFLLLGERASTSWQQTWHAEKMMILEFPHFLHVKLPSLVSTLIPRKILKQAPPEIIVRVTSIF